MVAAASSRLAAAAAVLLLAAACNGGDPVSPQVRVVNLELQESTVFEQRFRIDLRIGNPNDFDLPLDGLTFDLEVNGEDFARGFSNESVTVPRLGEATLSVTASTTLIEVVQQMRLLAERGDLTYRVHGTTGIPSCTSGAGRAAFPGRRRRFARRRAPYETEGSFRLLSRPETPGRTI